MYTIKRAAELTGVPPATLRAWERRYGIGTSERTEAGYRLYDEGSLARLRAMTALVADGWTPRNAAREVTRRAEEDAVPATSDARSPQSAAATGDGPAADTGRLVAAAVSMDAVRVSELLDERFALGSFDSVVDDWLMPALAALGRAWREGRVSIAGEHLVAHAVMRRLAMSYDAAALRASGPAVLVGLPPQVHHELGILAFAVALRRLGVAVVYLGADLPVTAWGDAADTFASDFAVTSVPRLEDVAAAKDVVRALRSRRADTRVFVGGSRQDALSRARVVRLGHAIGPAAAQVATVVAGGRP